ncbi:hypothetical protein NDU88_004196 [Pleurodeles waltl]|uniref:Secreted protein n=1 Tax=Pleurodeles waltl TaxID=8319 RepID=A0AAV7QF84_PLEWA|nr:hypothetical protein NDU88_004196 [Pleurodeles waltl]
MWLRGGLGPVLVPRCWRHAPVLLPDSCRPCLRRKRCRWLCAGAGRCEVTFCEAGSAVTSDRGPAALQPRGMPLAPAG